MSYRNLSAAPISIRGWTCGDFAVLEPGAQDTAERGAAAPAFWSYSGASYEDRRDWVQPVKHGFAQDNFLGMEASDYGGGTPIVDVWRRDGGLAVGHVETSPEAGLAARARTAGPRPRRRVLPRKASPRRRGLLPDTGHLRLGARRRPLRHLEHLSADHGRSWLEAGSSRLGPATNRSGVRGATNATAPRH